MKLQDKSKTIIIPFRYDAVQVPLDPNTWDEILAPALGIPSFEAAGLILSQKEGKVHLWDEYLNCPISAVPGDWILVRLRPSGTKGVIVMSDEEFIKHKKIRIGLRDDDEIEEENDKGTDILLDEKSVPQKC